MYYNSTSTNSINIAGYSIERLSPLSDPTFNTSVNQLASLYPVTALWSNNGYSISGIPNPTSSDHVSNKQYIDDQISTVAGTI